jgi:hypothetical protein
MGEERLAEIRASVVAAPHPAPGTWARFLRDLIAEVDRLLVERAERNIVLNDVQVENAEFRARIAELEALVESMCAALTGHDCPDPAEGPMATVTRSAIRLMEAEARVAELEAAARPAILDLPPSRVTRRALAGMGAPVEDPHDSPLHHAYRVARDLDVSVSRFMPKRDALCVCGHTGLDHHHAGFACWAHLPRGPRASMAEPLPPVEICGCKVFTAAGPGEQL